MTAEEYAKNIENCVRELEEKVPDFVLAFGVSLSSQIRERIQLRGEGKDGAFKKYTVKYDAYKTKKRKNQGFRDLTFSGDLMKEFGVYKNNKNYEIGFKKELSKDIAEGNSKYAGVDNIIEAKDDEIDIEIEQFEISIMNLLKKYLA